MVNYCIDVKTCKRNLIAQHFNDDLWDKSGKCEGMCDTCVNNQRGNRSIQINCLAEAKLVCEVIERNGDKGGGKKETRVTANKLVDLVYSELNSKKNKGLEHNHLSKTQLENLILIMLMRKYLKEDFHFTPYNTICYVVNGSKAGRLDFEVEFLMTTIHQAPESVIKPTFLQKPVKKTAKEGIKYELIEDNEHASNQDCLVISDDDNSDAKKIPRYEEGDEINSAKKIKISR